MNGYTLKDLVVPAEDYASIAAGASVRDGIFALKAAQLREYPDEPGKHRDRAVLVKDPRGEIVGKLSMWSIIGCLAPNYDQIKGGSASSKAAARIGSARGAIEEIMESSYLWRSQLTSIADDTVDMTIEDLLHAPRKKELIDEGASLEQAIHQLVSGHFMSLLVTRDDRIVGVLRLVDVFEAVCRMIGREEVDLTRAV